MNESALKSASGRAILEAARTLLRRGQTLAAIPLIKQAMPHHPEAATELMREAEAQIHAIQEVIQRAVGCSSSRSALEMAQRATRAIAQIGAALIRGSIRLDETR